MQRSAILGCTLCRWLVATAAPCCAMATTAASALEVKTTQNTERLMPYQVLELTFQHEGKYHRPNWDVSIDVAFRSPSGKEVSVGGFFYGSSKPQKPILRESKDAKGNKRTDATWPCDPADLWKARYAPSEVGPWRYHYVFRNDRGESAQGDGIFVVARGRVQQRGWVRVNPENPYRFVFEDGSPFYPVGFQDGIFDQNHNGSAMDTSGMDEAAIEAANKSSFSPAIRDGRPVRGWTPEIVYKFPKRR